MIETKDKQHVVQSCAAIAKEEYQGFMQVTAFKAFQFVKHSTHWTESLFWIVLLVGATGLAFRDIRKVYREFADEETYTSMSVKGLQRLTFEDALICVDYDPRALNLSDVRLIQHAEMSTDMKVLAKRANVSSLGLLNRLQKLITVISLTEHGRTKDYENKVRELLRNDDLQELHDWLRAQGINISAVSKEVGNWLCNAFEIRIGVIKRGHLSTLMNPCTPAKISWLGTIPFTSFAASEAALCIDIDGVISFDGMFDRVVISCHTKHLYQDLPSSNESWHNYPLNSYVDFSGDPVSTDMTKDTITFPDAGCLSFNIGIDAKLKLKDRWAAPCNETAKTRLACYAGCDMLLYSSTTFANCTLLAWRYLHGTCNPKMCFDVATIEEHVESRRRTPKTNVSERCWTSCLFPCEFRQYDIVQEPAGCSKDNQVAVDGSVAVELNPRRFTVPVFEENFSPTLPELFSRIGGTCGLWLGVGLLGICHALIFPLKLLAKLLLKFSFVKSAGVQVVVELGQQ